jgi:hypothetical protein
MAKIIKQVRVKLANIIQTLWKTEPESESTSDLPSQKDRRYFT